MSDTGTVTSTDPPSYSSSMISRVTQSGIRSPKVISDRSISPTVAPGRTWPAISVVC